MTIEPLAKISNFAKPAKPPNTSKPWPMTTCLVGALCMAMRRSTKFRMAYPSSYQGEAERDQHQDNAGHDASVPKLFSINS